MIALGELFIDRVEELCGAFVGLDDFLDGVPREVLARDDSWRARHGIDLATGNLVTSVHSWIVRTKHHTILIDTCHGNDKDRGGNFGHMLQIDWLDRLAAKGIPVDIVFEQ